ncbi:MAG: RecQ family ATP-dependent DNA helicase [Spirochaetaceae bacterium]|jgi:ATP-dependent DNA helicase RecQ|nr:RecQ family ATP-dependent DNA helicase [Spirochaetaceae bacterium]
MIDDVTLTDPLNEAARKLFGLSYLFPYQRLVIANLVEAAKAEGISLKWPDKDCGSGGFDDPGDFNGSGDPAGGCDEGGESRGLGRQIVILPTGAGKSLCFQLPAMLMDGPTLVIYPILSLMADQERRLRERGFSPVLLRGGQDREERERIWAKLASGESKFIIANPEVLLSPRVEARLPEIGIVHTVIDEAHCVSEWGESFRPAYLEIHRILEKTGSPMVTAFTATASAPVLERIETYVFGGSGAHRIAGNPDRPNIEYRAKACILRDLAVRDLILANRRPAIVFCSSRSGTQKLARYLRNQFIEMGMTWARELRFYHAGLDREEKKDIETWYLHNTEAVLVCTCAFGLGVDTADIRTVIHRDCPPSVEAYLQEAGRAGRDGKQSLAVFLWGPGDRERLRSLEVHARERMARLFRYARDWQACRREGLLKLLDYEGTGEKPEGRCCDACAGESSPLLREEESLRDFFRRNRRSYTLEEAALVLAQAETVRWSAGEAKEAVQALLQKGTLKKLTLPFWKNKITLLRQGNPPPLSAPASHTLPSRAI